MKSTQYIKSLILLSMVILTAHLSHAQDAAAATAAPLQASAANSFMYMMAGLAAGLLIVTAILGQVLVRLTMYVYEKKVKLAKSVLIFLILSLSGHSLFAQDASAPAAVQGSHSVFPLNAIVALTIVLTEALVAFVLLIRILALINTISPEVDTGGHLNFELNNQLPPWWKWGFAFTIVWAMCYFSYFHIFHEAPLSAGEYDNEMAAAKAAKNKVDETTIAFDANYVADGQKIFTENCVACHGSKGEGGVGPNLTDDYWMHGGKINDVFKSVKYGWPANGMKSWRSDLSPAQTAQVVCYVKSLRGTNPEFAKPPQGELYTGDGPAKAGSHATASIAVKDAAGK